MITEQDIANDAALIKGSDADLQNISNLVRAHQQTAQKIEQLEALLTEEKKRLRLLELEQIPNAMLSVGVEAFKTDAGEMVTVAPIITGSIPKKNEQEAFAWLRDNGHADIIKNVLTLSFAKSEDNVMKSVAVSLEEQGLAPTVKTSVHSSTLKSWAKQQIEEGNDIPLELLGIFNARKAKIQKG